VIAIEFGTPIATVMFGGMTATELIVTTTITMMTNTNTRVVTLIEITTFGR